MRKIKILLSLILLFFPLLGRAVEKDIYVVHFILDGLRQDLLYRELKAGALPNLKREIFDQGASFKEAITVFPTVSSPAYVSFTTGLGASKSGIFFLEWFDRSRNRPVGYMTAHGYQQVNVDFLNRLRLHDPDNQHLYMQDTLFEKLGDIQTASIYSPFRIGADIVKPGKLPFSPLWNGIVVKDGLRLNKNAFGHLKKVFNQGTNKLPRYTLVGLFGTDLEGHKNGPESTEVVWNLRDFDREFGQFTEQLKKRGIREKTYLIVTSDHGMHKTGKKVELPKLLRHHGLGRIDGIYASNRGVSANFIYAVSDNGWQQLPSLYRLRHFPKRGGAEIDLLATLLLEPGFEWVVARNGVDKVKIFTPQGSGDIQRVEINGHLFYSYRFEGKDPLQYADNANLKGMLHGKTFPPKVWLDKTLSETHPNAVVFLSELFHDPRAGDILVTAANEYSFRADKKGSHGSLTQGDLKIPLWIAGPDIPHGEFGMAQGVDLFPTILGWFGRADEATYQEGKPLFAAAREEEAIDPATLTLADLENRLTREPELTKQINRDYLEREIRSAIPEGSRKSVIEKLNAEIELRYQRWKKLEKFQEEAGLAENPLQIPRENLKNIDWLMATEKNIEFQRLRRLEMIRQLLNSER